MATLVDENSNCSIFSYENCQYSNWRVFSPMFDQTNPPQAPPAQCCSPKRMPPHNRPPSLLHMVHQWSESPQFFLEIPELAMDVVFWMGKSSTNGGWKKLPSTGTYLVDIRESELQYNIIYIYIYISLITYHNIISCLIICMFKECHQ